MSRTTRKYLKLFPTCTRPQVNTKWYKSRRKQFRAKNKCLLRYLLANYPVDINIDTELPMISDLRAKTVNDLIYTIKPRTRFDCYNEPSDGRFIIYYKDKYKKDDLDKKEYRNKCTIILESKNLLNKINNDNN